MNSLWKDKRSLISLTEVADTTGPVPFTKGMLLYWNIEATLQEAFDLRTREGQVSYAAWLLAHQDDLPGLYIFSHAQSFSHFAESVKQSIHFGEAATPVPAILYAVWKTREDLCSSFNLNTEIGRTGLCGNLLLNTCGSTPFIWGLKNYLAAPIAEFDGLPRILYAIWLTRSDLRENFPFKKLHVRQEIFLWAEQYGCTEYPQLKEILDHIKKLPKKINSAMQIIPRTLTSTENSDISTKNSSHVFSYLSTNVVSLPHGVNLFGYAFAPSGLGMDLRMVATALNYAQLPFCVMNCPMPTPSPASELSFLAYQTDKPKYDITVFCLPCGEIYRALCMLGENYFAGQYLIGQMPWEFSSWPSAQIPILHLLNEAWCLSSFIEEALVPVCPVPIRRMPRPIAYEPQPKGTRSTFNLPEDAYIFLFMWDGLSSSSRKNPEAVIHAFGDAFESTVRDVRLVLKTQHSFYDTRGEELKAAVAHDDRIQMIEGSFTQQEIWGLYAICDAYVALHRSEGFGLSLAEAMLAGKPVIASAYSGNLDFCKKETALCVPGTLVPVPFGEYPLAEGQEWFNVDIHKAADHMRYCYENRHKAITLARTGREYIRKHYSLATCSKYYMQRLQEIWIENAKNTL